MQKNNPSHKTLLLLQGGIVFCLLLMVALAFYGEHYHYRTAELHTMECAAERIAERIRNDLQEKRMERIRESFADFSKEYNIESIRLYGVDGTLYVALGTDQDGLLETPYYFTKQQSGGWPFQPWFQYSLVIHSENVPLAILILSVHNRDSVPVLVRYSPWLAIVLACCVVFLVVILRRIFRRFALVRETAEGEVVESCLPDDLLARMLQEKTAGLQDERDRAVASAKAKGDFLANMSHEIRTPMNGIIGVLSLLQKAGLRGENNRLLEAASRAAGSLMLIINDILDFSKIEAGKIDFEMIPFDLRTVVEESLLLYRDAANAKGIELLCYLPVDIPCMVIGDPTRLRQVVTNLINNAVKFTQEGEISLSVEVINAVEGRQRLRFTIEDTGIGIAQEKLDNLFDMFYQADDSTTRNYGGTGLGLSVCKNLVEMQGGECGVWSRLGAGTTFWFSMSFRIEIQAPIPLSCAELDEKKIIIFDDCETSRTILGQYLKECRVELRSGSGAGEIAMLLEKLCADGFSPDIILIDYRLLGGAVRSFCETVTAFFTQAVPEVYILTSEGGLTEKLIKDGADGIITKPIRLYQLFEELTGMPLNAGTPIAAAETEDILQGSVLLVDDEPINRRVAEAILKRTGLEVESVGNGREALARTERRKYDLLLLDIQMPEMSGFEVAESIRRREKDTGTSRQTIIAVTGNVLESVKKRCLDVGMDDFIAKPITPELLIAALRPWLRTTTMVAAISPVSEKIEVEIRKAEVEQQLVIWDRSLALSYVGGDEALLRELMRLYLQREQILFAALERAVADADADLIADAAHAFKGAVNHFAASQAQLLARTIEDQARMGQLDNINLLTGKLGATARELQHQLQNYLTTTVIQ